MILASTAGFSGVFSAPLYCTTKHGVVGFVRSMEKLDGLEDIKVVGIAPGYVLIFSTQRVTSDDVIEFMCAD